MKYRFLKYFLVLTIPYLAYLAFNGTGIITFAPFIQAFVIIPFIELFLVSNEKNLSDAEEEMIKDDRIYDVLLYLCLPTLYFLLWTFLGSISQPNLSSFDKVGRVLSMGLLCGSFGINIGHELGHRYKNYEQFIAKLFLLSSMYMHFFIEHNRGHHKKVSTKEDPSSARYGENIFSFWFRSIISGYISSWNLEFKRLKRSGKSSFSLSNQMLQFQLIQFTFAMLIYYLFGLQILFYFFISAFIGILTLETVNYIEHYGLQRRENNKGNYERIKPHHSWNSNHPIGRIMLFELSRHSDHHYNSLRKYQILKNHKNTPQMPTGYPGMMILALVPPLWFYVMNRRLRYYFS